MSTQVAIHVAPVARREGPAQAFSALKAAFTASVRERVRYPGDVLGFAVFLALLLFIFASLWKRTAAGSGDLGGWSAAQLVAYLLVTELVILSPGWLQNTIAASVRSGDLATDLLRPVDWIAWQLALAAGTAVVRGVVLLAAGVPTLVLLVGVPELDWRGVAFGLLVLVPLAVLVDSCARLLVGLLAFWFEESQPFYWVWQKLGFVLGGLMLPLDFYPSWLRTVAECLPFSAQLFAPARAVVRFDPAEALPSAARLLGWLAVGWLLLVLVHGRASRRLQLNGG